MTSRDRLPPFSRRESFDTTTLTDRVHEELREDILTNRLPPDTPLQEASIAKALGVSRGPVREALRKLAAEGLVRLFPRKGAVVSSLTREEFLDAYRVREVLEGLAVRLACSQLTDEDITQLQSLSDEMFDAAEQSNEDRFFAANADFHALFVDRSGNLILQDMYFPLFDQMRRYRVRSVGLRGGLKRSCEEHQAILDAIKTGNEERAVQLLQEHIQQPQRILEASDTDEEMKLAARSSPQES